MFPAGQPPAIRACHGSSLFIVRQFIEGCGNISARSMLETCFEHSLERSLELQARYMSRLQFLFLRSDASSDNIFMHEARLM